MANQKNLNYIGYKFFRFPVNTNNEIKEIEEKAEICRVIRAYNNGQIMVKYEDGSKGKTTADKLMEDGWQILSAPGIITASIVIVRGFRDVIVTFHEQQHILEVNRLPSVICRQSVTDFFYSFLADDDHHPYVGVSVSQRTCPSNIKYSHLLACDEIEHSIVAHTYMDDTIDDMIEILNSPKFDEVLRNLFEVHIRGKDPMLAMKQIVHGWCSNLKLLLESNNFLVDVDQEFGISTVDFNVDEHLIVKKDISDVEYFSFDPDATIFFMRTYRVNITDNYVIPYGYDIDFEEYSHTNYLLVRSSTGKLYMMVYMCDGEYIETDLEIVNQEQQIEASLNLHVYNKYRKNRK